MTKSLHLRYFYTLLNEKTFLVKALMLPELIHRDLYLQISEVSLAKFFSFASH